MENTNPTEQQPNKESMSKKTLKIFLPDDKGGEPIGEIHIENGQFVAIGSTEEDTAWLNRKLENIWQPQAGIPMYRQIEGIFVTSADGRYVLEQYANHQNCTADELLNALYNNIRAFEKFKLILEDRV